MALTYHAGQIAVQEETNSRPVADMLAVRTSGRSERTLRFYAAADLLVLASPDAAGRLRFAALSGAPPLLTPAGEQRLLLHEGAAGLQAGVRVGAIAIDLQERRRARANGTINVESGRTYLQTAEELLNCRKYIAPSLALEAGFHQGPVSRQSVEHHDERLQEVLRRAETAFLASISPGGTPDVSHKGGPPGFLRFDASSGTLSWPELIGNGMFKSAGNVRATGAVSLLALDLASGDGYELAGRAEYRSELRYDEPRDVALWPSQQDFPVQGVMTLRVEEATLLEAMILPRKRLKMAKVTACSPREDQVPT